jgi:hypothetical protein
MSAIYARQRSGWAGSFASDIAALSIAGNAAVVLGIVQNVNVTFAQNISRIYDVSNGGASSVGGVVPVFYVGGRTQGSATIGRVVGPKSGDLCTFYETMGNVCTPQDVQFTFSGGCGYVQSGSLSSGTPTTVTPFNTGNSETGVNSVTYSLEGCVTTQIGIQVNSNDMIVNENVQLMFVNMSCDKGPSA